MSAGHPGSDLGRIHRDDAPCEVRCMRCEWRVDINAGRTGSLRGPAIRAARAHVAATRHRVEVTQLVWQYVDPVGGERM